MLSPDQNSVSPLYVFFYVWYSLLRPIGILGRLNLASLFVLFVIDLYVYAEVADWEIYWEYADYAENNPGTYI